MRDKQASLTIASPTVAQGLNVNASAVLFESLYRTDRSGVRHRISAEEFQNVVGRAGRAFVDLVGKAIFSTGMRSEVARQNEIDWLALRREVANRQLESGLVTLILRLLERLGGFTDDRLEFLTQHANIDCTMNNEPLAGDDESQFEPSVDDLDLAINALLQGAGTDEEDVAGLLDRALRGSLFRRTLERKAESLRRFVTVTLEARARTMVRRFPAELRQSAYLSGVSPRLSPRFSALVDSLSPAIVEIEAAIDANAVGERELRLLADVAEALLQFPSFAPPSASMVDRPAEVIRLWLSGAPLGVLVDEAKTFAFLEEGIRTRAAWGYEAVRRAIQGEKYLTISGAALLISGTPTVFSALLVREGLDSRSTAVSVAALFPLELERRASAMREWLDEHEAAVLMAIRGSEASYRAFWGRFRPPIQATVPHVILAAPFGAEPAKDELVFVFVRDDVAEVTDRDLRPFARGAALALASGAFGGIWLGGGRVSVEDR